MLQHVCRRNLRPIRVEIKIEKMRLFEPARFATSDITLLFITDSIFGFLSEIMQAAARFVGRDQRRSECIYLNFFFRIRAKIPPRFLIIPEPMNVLISEIRGGFG
jgi:hypothetical protein